MKQKSLYENDTLPHRTFRHWQRFKSIWRTNGSSSTSTWLLVSMMWRSNSCCKSCQTSGQSNLQKGRITATHERFNRIREVAPMCTPSYTCFLESIPVHIRNCRLIGSAILHSSRQTVLIHYNGPPFPPQTCPFAGVIWTPHLIHGSLGAPESTTQMASSSVQPLL